MRIACIGGSGFIGRHLVEFARGIPSIKILNLDIASPTISRDCDCWRQVDILDYSPLNAAILDFQPTHIFHLAARIDMEGDSLADYAENIQGTANVLAAAANAKALRHIVVASTQHVRKPGSGLAQHDEDFCPYGAYGQSKVETEKMTRAAGLNCKWTIVRPTAIWGPGHLGLAKGLWNVISKRMYVHPRNDQVIRSYGYVKNVVHQLMAMIAKPDVVDRQVLYVGDPCVRQLDWVNAFSEAIVGQKVRSVPTALLYGAALVGEGFRYFGLPAPLYLERYKNLVTANPVPIERTMELLGPGPYSLKEGVEETVHWLRTARLVKG